MSSPPRAGIRLTRRRLLSGAASLGATSLLPAPGPARERIESLGALAADKGLLFGASFAVHELDAPHGSQYAQLYEQEVRLLTSELEFKLSTLRPDARTIDFAPADRLLAFAHAHGLPVRGHTLIWNDALPDWIKAIDPRGAGHLLDTHIDAVMTRYKGGVRYWDVVNEPIAPWDRQPGNLRAGPFHSALGEAYISRSFRAAHAADPAARLVLNEAFTETADEQGETFRRSLLALVRRLAADNTPIDAIGLQCHLAHRYRYDFARFTAFIDELASLGYEIHLTELDVDDRFETGSIAERDRRTADLYARFLAAVLPVRAIKVLSLWQLADHTSWLATTPLKGRGTPKPPPRPLVYDASFQKKLAWHAIADAFRAMPPR